MRILAPLCGGIAAIWVGCYAMAPTVQAPPAPAPAPVQYGLASTHDHPVKRARPVKASAQTPEPAREDVASTRWMTEPVESQRPNWVNGARFWIPPPDTSLGIPAVENVTYGWSKRNYRPGMIGINADAR